MSPPFWLLRVLCAVQGSAHSPCSAISQRQPLTWQSFHAAPGEALPQRFQHKPCEEQERELGGSAWRKTAPGGTFSLPAAP